MKALFEKIVTEVQTLGTTLGTDALLAAIRRHFLDHVGAELDAAKVLAFMARERFEDAASRGFPNSDAVALKANSIAAQAHADSLDIAAVLLPASRVQPVEPPIEPEAPISPPPDAALLPGNTTADALADAGAGLIPPDGDQGDGRFIDAETGEVFKALVDTEVPDAHLTPEERTASMLTPEQVAALPEPAEPVADAVMDGMGTSLPGFSQPVE